MRIISVEDPNAKKVALDYLKKGEIVIFPTETAYGVGVDATNFEAVTKVLDYKKRPEGKAISIGVYSKEMAERYVELNETAAKLYRNFLPGALTVISKSKGTTDKRLAAENGTLGIRIPNYKFMLELIGAFDKPITTTSANSSGKKTPYNIDDILENVTEKQKQMIGLIIDAGQLPHNPPSTVIDTTTEELTSYRQGRIDPLKIKSTVHEQSNSVEDTIRFGQEIIKSNKNNEQPLLILLNGELGAGKTHLTKGIAHALNIEQIVKSPTYNYVNEYKLDNNKTLYHMDAWRIQAKEDLDALRFYEWFKIGNIIVVEWPSVVMNLDPKFFDKTHYLYVDFVIQDENKREIRVYEVN